MSTMLVLQSTTTQDLVELSVGKRQCCGVHFKDLRKMNSGVSCPFTQSFVLFTFLVVIQPF